ncbi:transcriptional regulator GutM [Raineyella fluvialis]|uniref:Transcriptional regulator n=1 Tax=Raineyella fluvialis TaxID=2662261 RepID=A0A5Q2F8F2_9ACTN|nr:transcriptional regulator GutM [Raineyella fluvialis]QGF23240.1 transcriptional regulator [Raineyella fluvialis]
MFWTIAIAFAVIYLTQTVLGLRQSKNFATTFTAMRRRGRVAIGKKQGLVVAGAIVMFLLDAEGRIVEGRKLSGVTVLSRFRPFPAFDGEDLATLRPESDGRVNRSIRAAVANARENYRIIMGGGTAPEPPGPLAGIGSAVGRLFGRRVPARR